MSVPVATRARTANVPGNRLPVPSRNKRPALAALALLLVVAGALGAALVVYRTGHRTDVLVAADTIQPGQRVSASDFTTARVSADGGSTVPAANERLFIGSYAITSIPAGTLITGPMFQATRVIPPNGEVVGVTITTPQRPADGIAAGSVVRAFFVPKQSASDTSAPSATVIVDAARVVSTQTSASNADQVTVSLLVDPDVAAELTAASNLNQVALAVLAPGTHPQIDFRKAS